MRRIIVDITTEATEQEDRMAAQKIMMDIMAYALQAGCSVEKIESVEVKNDLILPAIKKGKAEIEKIGVVSNV